jgi:ABC-type branched-subunit amino acid transport system ATPase component
LFTVNNATVLDNVLLGAHKKLNPGIIKCLFLKSRMKQRERLAASTATKILKFVGLEQLASTSPLALSFGNQRMLELARALIAEPSLLLLDEPASGLNDTEVEAFRETLLAIQAWGISILLIEHNMKLVMTVAEEIVVIDFGQKIAEGSPSEIGSNAQVIKAYLGEDYLERED